MIPILIIAVQFDVKVEDVLAIGAIPFLGAVGAMIIKLGLQGIKFSYITRNYLGSFDSIWKMTGVRIGSEFIKFTTPMFIGAEFVVIYWLHKKGVREKLRNKIKNLEGEPLISLTDAGYVAANVVQKNGTDQFILHFVNYDKPLENVRVRVNLDGYPIKINKNKIKMFSPDMDSLKVQEISMKGKTAEFTLPALNIYNVVVLN